MKTIEQWKIITAYPNYAVSNLGRVMRVVTNKYHPRQRILKTASDSDGYQVVTLYNPKPMTKKVHQLVMRAFVGPCPKNQEINHKNGIKVDNTRTNLEYVTPRQNKDHAIRHKLTAFGDRNAMRKYPGKNKIGEYAKNHPERVQGINNPKAKLSENDVREIRRLSDTGIQTIIVARRFGVTTTTIRGIKNRSHWRHI